MYLIEVKDFIEMGAPSNLIKVARSVRPESLIIINLLNNKQLEKEDIYWLHLYLRFTEEEETAYEKILEIKNSTTVFNSYQVTDSKAILQSEKVLRSNGVSESTRVTDSIFVVKSNKVERSERIFQSNFVENSEMVLNTSNVTNSNHINGSTFILNSEDILHSQNISDSHQILSSTKIQDSYFCSYCNNIKHCLFCSNVSNAEYLIFNEPIEKEIFETIKRQYLSWEIRFHLFKDEQVDFMKIPNACFRFDQLCTDFDFLDWARTLPGYSDGKMYALTLNKRFLI